MGAEHKEEYKVIYADDQTRRVLPIMDNEKARERLLKAIDEGRVEIKASDEAVKGFETTLKGGKPDFTVTGASISNLGISYNGSMGLWLEIQWSTVSAGFGLLNLRLRDGKLTIDAETMGKEFTIKVLTHLMNTWEKDYPDYKDVIYHAYGAMLKLIDAAEIIG